MAEQFRYPPEVLNRLVDTIPLLCRSKKDVVVFLQGAGVGSADLADVSRTVRTAPDSINKYEIVRTVLTKVNTRGDGGGPVLQCADFNPHRSNDTEQAKP